MLLMRRLLDAGSLDARFLRVRRYLEDTGRALPATLSMHANCSPGELFLAVDCIFGRRLRVERQQPRHAGAPSHESLGGFVHRRKVVAACAEEMEEPQELLAFVVRGLADLAVCQDGVENSEIGVAQGTSSRGVVRQVDEVPEDDVDEDVEVVGVEVLGRRDVPKEEVQDFEDKQLQGRLRLAIQEQDQVASKRLVSHSMCRESFHESVCHGRMLVPVVACRGYQILFVQNQLLDSQSKASKRMHKLTRTRMTG